MRTRIDAIVIGNVTCLLLTRPMHLHQLPLMQWMTLAPAVNNLLERSTCELGSFKSI